MRDLVVAAILAALCLWAAAVLARAVAAADASAADRPSGAPAPPRRPAGNIRAACGLTGERVRLDNAPCDCAGALTAVFLGTSPGARSVPRPRRPRRRDAIKALESGAVAAIRAGEPVRAVALAREGRDLAAAPA